MGDQNRVCASRTGGIVGNLLVHNLCSLRSGTLIHMAVHRPSAIQPIKTRWMQACVSGLWVTSLGRVALATCSDDTSLTPTL